MPDQLTYLLLGDVIQVNGPTVPLDLRDKWFIVEDVNSKGAQLSRPYLDPDCKQPYHPPDPRLKRPR